VHATTACIMVIEHDCKRFLITLLYNRICRYSGLKHSVDRGLPIAKVVDTKFNTSQTIHCTSMSHKSLVILKFISGIMLVV